MNVLTAVDLSPVTRAVIRATVELTRGRAGHVYLLHVAEPDPDFVGWEAGPEVVRQQVAGDFREAHRRIETLAAEIRAGGLESTGLLVQGPTVDIILDQARRLHADLIVVGTHGHGAAFELLAGSVSSGVIRGASVPVLVVPPGAVRDR